MASGSSFGRILRMTSFGESHGPGLGVVIDGCPAGLPLVEEDLEVELARRRPGQSGITSARAERDRPRILSGVFEGRTLGTPIAVLVENEDARSADYDQLRDRPRAGHADETWAGKFGHRDHRGGGRSSGRETLARVIAGVVARKILPPRTRVLAHARAIAGIVARGCDPDVVETNPVRCGDAEAAARMVRRLEELRDAHDSAGGEIEIFVLHPPPHLGEPVFEKLKATLAQAVMSVGAVTGFSYGAGFSCAGMRGSEYVADRAAFGGILGGISTGETIRMLAAVKPASSVGAVAKQGRHDPCVVPRVIPVLEAMVAFVLADHLLLHRAGAGSLPAAGEDRE